MLNPITVTKIRNSSGLFKEVLCVLNLLTGSLIPRAETAFLLWMVRFLNIRMYLVKASRGGRAEFHIPERLEAEPLRKRHRHTTGLLPWRSTLEKTGLHLDNIWQPGLCSYVPADYFVEAVSSRESPSF